MFVGHSHIQHTDDYTTPSGNKLTEVNIGSLVGYPAPIVNVTVNDDMTLSYTVEHLEKFTLNGKETDAQPFLAKHCTDLVHNVLSCRDKEEFAARITALQANGGAVAKFFFAIKPLLKFVDGATVGEMYKKLKHLGLARGIDKEAVHEFYNTKITDFIDRLLLSAIDGSVVKYDRNSAYYRLVMSIVSIPSKLLKSNTDMKRLIFTADTILTGGKYNNQNETI